MTYNSNGIEGNSLTLKETYLVIQEGITIKNKPLKDHLEARGHYEAIEFIADLVAHEKRHTLSEKLIRELHTLVIQLTEKEWAGRYRNANVLITGARHKPPDALEVPGKMSDLVMWFHRVRNKLHPVELAAIFHHRFVHIHPFFDGNGRVGRLLMNVLLMQQGYPITVILKNERKKYYDVLERADGSDPDPLVRFVARNVERSLDIYLKTLTPSDQKIDNAVKLSEISPKTPYSAKYLNLLVRSGKLEAYKEGRDWLTTLEAVERYIFSRKRKRRS